MSRSAATPAPEPPDNPARSHEAAKLLEMFTAAKPIHPDAFVPGIGMPGGADIPQPTGLYTYALIGPDVWPSESESQLASIGGELIKLGKDHDTASESADAQVQNVFSEYWTEGDGAAAAAEHYRKEHAQHQRLAEAYRFIGSRYRQLSEHFRTIKRKMRDAHDNAHREIEETLRANKGQPVGVGPILTRYRTEINEYSAELRGFVADEITMLGNEIPLPQRPPGQGGESDGRGQPADDGTSSSEGNDGTSADPGRGRPADPPPGGIPTPAGERSSVETIIGRGRPPDLPATQRPSLPQVPSVPQVPSTGGSSPLSGAASSGMGPLSGLLGGANPASSTSGLAGSAGNIGNPAAVQQASARAMSSALGGEFGRGLAAGASAAGSVGPVPLSQPIPQTPSTPLGVPPPGTTTPVSAAPASAPAGPLSAPSPGSAMGMPASAAGSGSATAPMTPYGSVLPTTPPSAGAASGPSPASLSPPPPSVTSGTAGVSSAPPAGFVPAVRDSSPVRIGRDVSTTDLESARAAVADLAAASSAVDPGLQWAVVVARGASGIPETWVTTNEGAGYIPPGVFVPRAMPLAAGLDPDFDTRWFGWSNPAETVLRAVQARGDAVSAIATTWPQDSEEVRAATEDVAIGVVPSGGPGGAEASTLTRGRSHRLETVDPALYHELALADHQVVDAYVRQVTQQTAFNAGPELSSTAQSVARTLISGRWPSEAEWRALRTEYDSARLMAGSQHPGLMGIEEPAQLITYQTDFVLCRRIETLLCWDDRTPADIAYAARAAGVMVTLTAGV